MDRVDYLHQKIQSLPVTRSAQALKCFQELLVERLDASNVLWFAVYKGTYGYKSWYHTRINEWKLMDIASYTDDEWDSELALSEYYSRCEQDGHMDPLLEHAIQSVGTTRVHRIRQCVEYEEWQKHWMFTFLKERDIAERMISVFSISDLSESCFVVDRCNGAKPFTKEDADEVHKLLIRFPRLHYWLMLERGLTEPATRPLSPREKQVLQLLLSSLPEAEIAKKLDLAKGTVHNYISSIYKIFNLNSRYELVQLWLREVPIR